MTLGAIENIRALKPEKLFFSIDGPREGVQQDKLKIAECMKALEKVDWRCDIQTLIADKNYGPGYWPQNSINWALTNVEKLMILEHDVRVSPDFYELSSKLLLSHENDASVFAICALNIEKNTSLNSNYEFFYTKYFSSWGWATWADRWSKYRYEIEKKDIIRFRELLQLNGYNFFIAFYFYYYIRKVANRKLRTWDFQINNLMFTEGMKVIRFHQNLSTNVGVGVESTHTKFIPELKIEEASGKALLNLQNNEVKEIDERRWRKYLSIYIYKSVVAKFKIL